MVDFNIVIEARPRLQNAHIAVFIEASKNDVDFTNDPPRIELSDQTVSLNGIEFNIRDDNKLKFQDDSASLLSISTHAALFCAKLAVVDSVKSLQFVTEVDDINRSWSKLKPPEMPDKLPKDAKVQLQCYSCRKTVAEMNPPQRFLSAPSTEWRSISVDQWFCCVSKLSRPPSLRLRETDFLFGGALSGIHPSHMKWDMLKKEEIEAQEPLTHTSLILCPCSAELGLLVTGDRALSEQSPDALVQLWNSSHIMHFDCPDTAESEQPEDMALSPHAAIGDAFAAFRAQLLSEVLDHPKLMLKYLILPTRTASCSENLGQPAAIELWLMDKNLALYSNRTLSASHPKTTNTSGMLSKDPSLKVIYRPLSQTELMANGHLYSSHDSMVVSCQMLTSILAELEVVMGRLPPIMREAGIPNFKVAYISIRSN